MEIAVAQGDALEFECDVLVLKHAGALYGVDLLVVNHLKDKNVKVPSRLPRPGGFLLVASNGALGAANVLFVGTPPILQFGYAEIRRFAARALEILAGQLPTAKQIAFTLHGPGFGLDESESFHAEVAGFLDAERSGELPAGTRRVTLVELESGRTTRLRKLLGALSGKSHSPSGLTSGSARPIKAVSFGTSEPGRLRSAGPQSHDKAHVFVAMPFDPAFDDRFHYGIQSAVHAAGYLCERADLTPFTGDVLTRVKDRIASSRMLIADLSTANPNVYLEVGFAWGVKVPTILVVDDPASLKFDVSGQRCLIYQGKIRKLEADLRTELQALG